MWHDDDEEEEEEETSKQAAIMRYDQFRMVYGDLLDSSLEEEFQTMRQMGLPTMLINSYGDMEYDDDDDNDVCVVCACVCDMFHMYMFSLCRMAVIFSLIASVNITKLAIAIASLTTPMVILTADIGINNHHRRQQTHQHLVW